METYTTVSARLNTQVKNDAERVLSTLGLSHSSAIAALYSQIVLQQGMPFDLKIPQKETLNRACVTDIDTVRTIVCGIAKEYGVEKVWLFGSRARGEAHQASDIDLLVDKGDLRGLECGGFAYDLEQSLGMPVDIVTTTSVPEKLAGAIDQDKVLLYER